MWDEPQLGNSSNSIEPWIIKVGKASKNTESNHSSTAKATPIPCPSTRLLNPSRDCFGDRSQREEGRQQWGHSLPVAMVVLTEGTAPFGEHHSRLSLCRDLPGPSQGLQREMGHCGPVGRSCCSPRHARLTAAPSPRREKPTLPKLSFSRPIRVPAAAPLAGQELGLFPCTAHRKDKLTLKAGSNLPISRVSFYPGQKSQSNPL